MASSGGQSAPSSRRLARATQVIVVGSVMFTFISYWRTAAVVLCDIASTVYYIGGIVEQQIGKAAPWFILAVMCFSYAVRSVYIESCSMFVRGGVYRVVRSAMGGFMGKVSVSALIFDYILTGPISSVTAGQYVLGLLLEMIAPTWSAAHPALTQSLLNAGSVAVACAVTVYFFRQNLKGIHESSDKAFKIMIATAVMAAIMLSWCGLTLAVKGRALKDPADPAAGRNELPLAPDFNPKPNYAEPVEEGHEPPKADPLGFVSRTPLGDRLRALNDPQTGPSPWRAWLSLIGLVGVMMAFGHSILAMSGEETLAQVYREVEAPKLLNFRRAALVVFVFSLVVTAG